MPKAEEFICLRPTILFALWGQGQCENPEERSARRGGGQNEPGAQAHEQGNERMRAHHGEICRQGSTLKSSGPRSMRARSYPSAHYTPNLLDLLEVAGRRRNSRGNRGSHEELLRLLARDLLAKHLWPHQSTCRRTRGPRHVAVSKVHDAAQGTRQHRIPRTAMAVPHACGATAVLAAGEPGVCMPQLSNSPAEFARAVRPIRVNRKPRTSTVASTPRAQPNARSRHSATSHPPPSLALGTRHGP